jgi:ribosomal protein S18 acetylase RimI-like enzyme
MIIRPTKLEDKQSLIKMFHEEGILDGFPMSNGPEIEDSCSFWMDMALKGYGITCEIDGQVAGLAVLYIPIYFKLQKAALFSIVVDATFRRKNVGTALIKALEHLGITTYGLSIIHLEVYEKNWPAISLYEKLGYQKYGIQEKFIKENNVYFNKILMEKRFP